jgi:hypothetical protein
VCYQRFYGNGMATVMGMLPSPMPHLQSQRNLSTIPDDIGRWLARNFPVDIWAD